MERRITEVTSMANVQYVVPSPDGHTYLFAAGGGAAGGAAADAAAGPGTYTIADDGTRQTRLNTTPTDAAGRGRGGRGGGGGGGANEPTWALRRSQHLLHAGRGTLQSADRRRR